MFAQGTAAPLSPLASADLTLACQQTLDPARPPWPEKPADPHFAVGVCGPVKVLVQLSGAGARLDVKISASRRPFGIRSQSSLPSPPRLAGTGRGTSSYVEASAQYDGLGPLVR